MAVHQIKVSGHLEDKRGVYQMALSWKANGKRERKSISTGLPIKGNKKKAELMLRETRLTLQESLSEPIVRCVGCPTTKNMMVISMLM